MRSPSSFSKKLPKKLNTLTPGVFAMANVNDPTKYRERFDRELRLVDERLDDETATALRRWVEGMTTAYSTRSNHLANMRRCAEYADGSLLEMDEDLFYDLLATLRDGSAPGIQDGGLAAGTLRTMRSSARLFFRDALGREWAEDIEVGAAGKSPVTPEHLVDSDDISALFDAATSPRDAALLGTLLATGQRISAALSIRVGDVDLDGRSGVVRLNDEALGLKGASGPRPLLWATGHVSRWLAVHPRRDEDDAPLFCTLKAGAGGNNQTAVRRYERGEPLSRHQAHSRLKDLAEAADVDPVRVKPHNLRHAAITRMVREGLAEQKIKWLVGWADDSSQFERYQHLTDDEMLESVLEDYDLTAEDVDRIGQHERTTCERCGTALRPGATYCDSCGLAMTDTAYKVEHDILRALARLDEDTAEELLAFVESRARG